jgi:large-conductance mechanosensitive channel
MIVKVMNTLKKKPVPVVAAAPPAATREENLLMEIRDVLKTRPVEIPSAREV